MYTYYTCTYISEHACQAILDSVVLSRSPWTFETNYNVEIKVKKIGKMYATNFSQLVQEFCSIMNINEERECINRRRVGDRKKTTNNELSRETKIFQKSYFPELCLSEREGEGEREGKTRKEFLHLLCTRLMRVTVMYGCVCAKNDATCSSPGTTVIPDAHYSLLFTAHCFLFMVYCVFLNGLQSERMSAHRGIPL